MQYYSELAKLKCFSQSDVEKLTGNATSAYSLLCDYKKKGYVDSVKRNLYVTLSLENGNSLATRYEIASKIKDDAYITHHSALEYHGIANQVFYEVYVSGMKHFNPFEYDDVLYKYATPRSNLGVIENADGVRATDMERTLLDSISDFEKIGGLEEVLKSIELIPFLDEAKLLDYLKKYNKQVLFQKSGYILSHFQNLLRLSDDFFAQCEKNTLKSSRYLYSGVQHTPHKFDNRWQLVVPENLLKVISKGVEMDDI